MKHLVWENECGRKWEKGKIRAIDLEIKWQRPFIFSWEWNKERGKKSIKQAEKGVWWSENISMKKKVEHEIQLYICCHLFYHYVYHKNADLKNKREEKPLLFLPPRESHSLHVGIYFYSLFL